MAARAALALGRTGKLLAADPLLQHTQASDAAIRAMVIYGLGLLGPTLAGSDLSAMLRPLAAERRARAGTAIVGALSDGSDAVRIAALDATARFANARAFSPQLVSASFDRVTHILRADPSPVIRGRAAYALAWYDPADTTLRPRAVRALENAFAAEDDANARWHEMWALGRAYPKQIDAKTLRAGLADTSDLVRIMTLHALERRADASWIARVTPLTRDPNWRVNEEAREAMAQMRGGKRTEHLKAIPQGVVTPAPAGPIPTPLARAAPAPSPTKVPLASFTLTPHILPNTIATMTGPAPGPHPRVAIETTQGTIVVVLYPEWAPSTVANFLNLSRRGYYDDNRWFRIVPDFVVQSGDKTNTGDGGVSYTIPAEENPLDQDSGVISMGLEYGKEGAKRDSAGSQFYITLSPQPHLDMAFTVFGHVERGFDVLGRLVESDRILHIQRLPDENLGG